MPGRVEDSRSSMNHPAKNEPGSLLSRYQAGRYLDVISSPRGQALIHQLVDRLENGDGKTGQEADEGVATQTGGSGDEDEDGDRDRDRDKDGDDQAEPNESLLVGLAALDAFLQANVTGPVLVGYGRVEGLFRSCHGGGADSGPGRLRERCLGWLEVDGVAPYPHIPQIELFCLARHVLGRTGRACKATVVELSPSLRISLEWTRLRVCAWHHRLLTRPSLGAGSSWPPRTSHWSDVSSLVADLAAGMDQVRRLVIGDGGYGRAVAGPEGPENPRWSRDDRVLCLVEMVNIYAMLGREDVAGRVLEEAVAMSGLERALSGAFGKRTRFQQRATCQLVVLAKSRDGDEQDEKEEESTGERGGEEGQRDLGWSTPTVIPLDDDTLLENIAYQKQAADLDPAQAPPPACQDTLPESLARLEPDRQPTLRVVDQIILLTEATLQTIFFPVDSLTVSQVLPYAVRVLADSAASNWQVHTQALLVRSRIELQASRTNERAILQLQAVIDQVIDHAEAGAADKADAAAAAAAADPARAGRGEHGMTRAVPAIAVTAPPEIPASIAPRPKAAQGSAPPQVRLRYVHALAFPPRWHLEAELAQAWASVGSLVSALEIFRRLHLWAEVALCLAGAAAGGDADGRGAGGDVRARAVLRWRLFTRTGTAGPPVSPSYPDPDSDVPAGTDPTTDPTAVAAFAGPARDPPPADAPRLLCILGDLEADPAHYEAAWAVSRGRYARAQKSLGEHYAKLGDWAKAGAAYGLATHANRHDPELWSRLGDMRRRQGLSAAAAAAYGRAVATAGETDLDADDARTWSNLGSAMWQLRLDVAGKDGGEGDRQERQQGEQGEPEGDDGGAGELRRTPADVLATRALAAYKRAVAISRTNWRIWDNILTVAASMRPPAHQEMVYAIRQITQLRGTEDALDVNVLKLLLYDVVLVQEPPTEEEGAKVPTRTMARAVVGLMEDTIVPLITRRAELWELVWRERAWRGDRAGAADAAEKAWRIELGGTGGDDDGSGEPKWLVDEAAWCAVVSRTDHLVAALETCGGEGWRSRARSAVRSVMGRGRAVWEGSGSEWTELEKMIGRLRGK